MKRICFFAAVALLLSSCGCEYKEAAERLPNDVSDVWVMTPMDSIGVYRSMAPDNEVILYMAKGDTEHFQMVIEPSAPGKLTMNRIKEKKSNIDMSLRRVAIWNEAEDVLVTTDGSVDVGGNAKLWVSYATTANTKPGEYNEILEFCGDSGCYHVKVTVKVYDCEIPEIPTIPSVFGIDPTRMGLPEGISYEDASAEKKRWSDLLLEYRISPYFSTWINETMKVENISSPWSWDDPRTVEYLKDERFGRIALPCHSLNDDELALFLSSMRDNGLLEKAYFYVWDEPKNMSEYDEVINAAARVHDIAPDAKVITSFFCGPQDGPRKDDLFAVFDILRGSTNIFCTGVWSLNTSEERADSCRNAVRSGEEWWTYVCMSDHPGLSIKNNSRIRNRATLWRSYKEGPTGFLYWVVNSYASIDPIIAREELPYGDGVLVYPGAEFGAGDDLLVSARLECWRDGAEEYELMKMLEAKRGRQYVLDILDRVYREPLWQTDNSSDVIVFKKELLEALSSM